MVGSASASTRTSQGQREPVSWADVRAEAARRFGVTRFRPGQRELIESVLAGRNALGILPTGTGKSLCYQLPALFLDGAVVVVSPLIALMQDQLDHLTEAQIGAARLDSTVPHGEQRRQEREIVRGARNVVLLSPERLEKPGARRAPEAARCRAVRGGRSALRERMWPRLPPRLSASVQVIEELGRPPVLALTATAPPERVRDILESLGIPDAQVIYTGIERENLAFEVLRTVNRD